jgi:hypothetical protein
MPIVGDTLLEWFNHLLGEPNIPQTISMSYADDERGLPMQYTAVSCQLFSQLGARGVSVLIANGVGNGNCEDNEGNVRFIPLFPSSCTCGVLSQAVQVAHKTAMLFCSASSILKHLAHCQCPDSGGHNLAA